MIVECITEHIYKLSKPEIITYEMHFRNPVVNIKIDKKTYYQIRKVVLELKKSINENPVKEDTVSRMETLYFMDYDPFFECLSVLKK